jgi:hypothetical protein
MITYVQDSSAHILKIDQPRLTLGRLTAAPTHSKLPSLSKAQNMIKRILPTSTSEFLFAQIF